MKDLETPYYSNWALPDQDAVECDCPKVNKSALFGQYLGMKETLKAIIRSL